MNFKSITWPDGTKTTPKAREAALDAVIAAVEGEVDANEYKVINKNNLPYLISLLNNVSQTTDEWQSGTEILQKGQLGIETTPTGTRRAKAGDGKSAWADLPYLSMPSDVVLSVAEPENASVWFDIPCENVLVSTTDEESSNIFFQITKKESQ